MNMSLVQRYAVVIISVWFQAIWFLAVVGRESTLIVLIVTLILGGCLAARLYQIGWIGLSLLVGLGFTVDTLNTFLELLQFQTPWLPVWLLCLWLAFALYAFVLLPQLNRFPKWAVLCVGGLGGSLSYLAGLKFGAVTTTFSTKSFVSVLFVEWVLMLAIASLLVARFPLVQKEIRE
ncbi:DUF2878 domain-containing protein [Vibrio astriarenae]